MTKSIHFFYITLFVFSMSAYSTDKTLGSFLSHLESGKPLFQDEHQETSVLSVQAYKGFFLVEIGSSVDGLCSGLGLNTYNYEGKLLDSLELVRMCDTDGGELESVNYDLINEIYNVKVITVANGYDHSKITSYVVKEYKLDPMSGTFVEEDPYKFCNSRKYPEISEMTLQPGSLDKLSARTLKLMRNEIFASYGYEFKSERLAGYFEKCSWYKPYQKDVSGFLTDLEKKNIEAILNQEKKLESNAIN
ncbi:YARHG domain-containing protein [Pleionea sediminis]|uniref:YARHG domain-containing protein n=1 Tax=Pleionea sediminis TaxID=2569479 RepID=UPI001185C41E|nr:YARHG domain-containing protein [Pleionea sediminis]